MNPQPSPQAVEGGVLPSDPVAHEQQAPVLVQPQGQLEAAPRPRSAPRSSDARTDKRLFIVVCAILALLTVIFFAGARAQWISYHAGIDAAVAEGKAGLNSMHSLDHAAILAYNRALGAAMIKSAALYLGYLLVFTGALYVLRSATAAYSLSVNAQGNQGALQTSSPGLVMITLGVALLAVTILTRSDVNYTAPAFVPQQSGSKPAAPQTDQTPTPPKDNLPTTLPPSQRK